MDISTTLLYLNQHLNLMCILLCFCIHNGQASANLERQYCPYFQNRAPSPQPSLKNCSWYRENACCLNEELSIIFAQLLPMAGANSECLKALNHLYCYVCSPDQRTFFNRDMLTVCEESCNLIYSKCGNALLKGVPWRQLYTNGTDFCSARKFLTGKAEMGQCFDFTGIYTSFTTAVTSSITVLVCCCLVVFSNIFGLTDLNFWALVAVYWIRNMIYWFSGNLSSLGS